MVSGFCSGFMVDYPERQLWPKLINESVSVKARFGVLLRVHG